MQNFSRADRVSAPLYGYRLGSGVGTRLGKAYGGAGFAGMAPSVLGTAVSSSEEQSCALRHACFRSFYDDRFPEPASLLHYWWSSSSLGTG